MTATVAPSLASWQMPFSTLLRQAAITSSSHWFSAASQDTLSGGWSWPPLISMPMTIITQQLDSSPQTIPHDQQCSSFIIVASALLDLFPTFAVDHHNMVIWSQKGNVHCSRDAAIMQGLQSGSTSESPQIQTKQAWGIREMQDNMPHMHIAYPMPYLPVSQGQLRSSHAPHRIVLREKQLSGGAYGTGCSGDML